MNPKGKPPLSAEDQAIYDAALERRLAEKAAKPPPPQAVIITDVDIKFWSMVRLLVKMIVAGIPATIIVVLIVWALLSIFGLVLSPFGRH